MKNTFMFSSESVTEGHPDKLCDQISDAIVDHFLYQDPHARIRAECAVSSAILFIAVRFASSAKVDFSYIARKVIGAIGYDQPDFNAGTCSVLTTPYAEMRKTQDEFDEMSLSDQDLETIPVQNQVTVFGFACDQTQVLLPLPIWLSHQLARKISKVRREKILTYLSPESKIQVGVEYEERRPKRIHSITITAGQLSEAAPDLRTLAGDIRDTVIAPVFKSEAISPDSNTRIFVNPEGPYLGGPAHHSGLTGRKNAIDTYGEYSRHSGKALSGKDPLRIDRIGAYAARHAAKNIVAAGLAAECEVMLSYSIGAVHPVSLQVHTRGTGKVSDDMLTEMATRLFDFRLAGILKRFELRYLPTRGPAGFYQKLAAYGHFGRPDLDLPWERLDRVDALSDESSGR